MTAKKKKKSSFSGGKTVTAAFGLCLLAVVAMIGMYTVGRSEAEQENLEEQIAEAEEQAREIEENLAKTEVEPEEEDGDDEPVQPATSASAARDWDDDASSVNEAELESDYAVADAEALSEYFEIAAVEDDAALQEAAAESRTLSFSPGTDSLLWPISGNILMNYSMDKSVYFETLDQYKYNPAVIIEADVGEDVLSAAEGQITSIETTEETGVTVTMDIGDGYEIVYGQLKDLTVSEGDYADRGKAIGCVAEPTRYYTKEGCNLYFAVYKDGESVDPTELMQ